jgi:LysR family glycine cleavage system transcriptional activator
VARPLLPLSGFRSFECAARHMSFARAADELHVTPAAVSHQVRTLEDYLGVRLFHRTGRTILLTDAGRELLPELREGFEKLEAGMARMMRKRVDGGLLTVSISPSFAAKWFLPRLERFRAAHPDIEVRIDTSPKLSDFRSDPVDVGLRYGMGGYEPLESIRLFGEVVFPVCSPQLLERDGPLRQPADLSRFTLLHDESTAGDPLFPTWRDWLDAAGVDTIDPERGLRFGLSIMAMQAASDAQGVLLGRSVLADCDLRNGTLVRPFELALPVRPAYWLVCATEACEQPRIRAFREWLLQEAGVGGGNGGDGSDGGMA